MKIVNIIGGLGNQMFQYAFACFLQNRSPQEDILIDTSHFHYLLLKKWKTANLHNGYELDKVFPNLMLPKASVCQLAQVSWYIPNYLLSRLGRRLLPSRKKEYIQPVEKYFTYDEAALSDTYCYLEGQWECIQYCLPIREKLKYVFAHGVPNNTNRQYIHDIANENSVGIHVRRGDYLLSETFQSICDIGYYQKGINKILEDNADHVFYIFSNDINWCKENISPLLEGHRIVLVTVNVGKDSCWDMFLMTYCKDLIIANSSFSWWAAFLNKRGGKVIAPQKWFNRDAQFDIWADEWIRI